jgi:hypothetical protein
VGRAANRKKQGRDGKTTNATPSLHISLISGMDGGVSLEREAEQVKAALLYADHVTLVSLKNVVVATWLTLREADAQGLVSLLAHMDDRVLTEMGVERTVLQQFGEILSRPRSSLTSEQRRYRKSMEQDFMGRASGLHAVAERELEASGISALMPAVEAGVLTFDTILESDEGDASTDDIVQALILRIERILGSHSTYPSFDEDMARLAHHAIQEGRFQPGNGYERRATSAGLGVGLVGRLPHFPRADISEILDIREELQRPLRFFRRGVSDLSTGVTVSADHADFAAQVDELYVHQVQPAVMEIDQLVHDDTSLRSIAERVVTDPAGAVATVGAGSLFGLAFGNQSLVAGALAAGAVGAASVLRAVRAAHLDMRGVEQNKFYFLYAADKRLE